MSEFARTTNINLLIPTENHDAALAALNTLAAVDGHPSVQTLPEAIKRTGFDFEVNAHGIALTYYDDPDGPQDPPLRTIANLVAPGSYVEWEDDEREALWRNDFDGHVMTTRLGRVVYDVPA